MAQITIEIPDEFAQRLEPFQGQLSELFTRFISTTLPSDQAASSTSIDEAGSPPGTYQEILDFLVSQPTSQRIFDFKVSEKSQARLKTLLQRNRDQEITAREQEELDLCEQLDTLIGLLKVRAFSITTH